VSVSLLWSYLWGGGGVLFVIFSLFLHMTAAVHKLTIEASDYELTGFTFFVSEFDNYSPITHYAFQQFKHFTGRLAPICDSAQTLLTPLLEIHTRLSETRDQLSRLKKIAFLVEVRQQGMKSGR
jgi:hypothetical protein